ncbi:MAG TPA: class I SAM-dependent methyltransferase [Alphaproteobacteria bacterium]
MIEAVKRALPWWAKIACKLVLARLPVRGRTWQSLGLFSPGRMLEPAYALCVFETHYRNAGSPAPGFRFLELGPGDSLASAVIGRAFGAAGCWLVDAGAYAARDMAVYRDLVAYLSEARAGAALDAAARAGDVDELLAACGAVHLEDGLASLRSVPAASCDFVFSQAVLEHVPREQFAATLRQTWRILRPGGTASHNIDFRDHLGGGLDHLRFSERLWEAPWFARRSGFYTNRLRPSEMARAFEEADFAAAVETGARWDRLPIARERLDAAFRALPDEELAVQTMRAVLRKEGGHS